MAPASDPEKNVLAGQNHRKSAADRSNSSRNSRNESALLAASTPSLPPTDSPASKRRKTDSKSKSRPAAETRVGAEEENRSLAVDTSSNGSHSSTPLPTPNGSKRFMSTIKKDDEVYSKHLIRTVTSGYDMDADSDNDEDGSGTAKQALIMDSWKPEYASGNQVLAHPNSIPRALVTDDDLYIREKYGFAIPVKLISYNQNSPYIDSDRFSPALPDTVRPPIHYEVTAADMSFIEKLNTRRKLLTGERYMTMELFRKIIHTLEVQTFLNIHDKLLDQVHRVYLPSTRETECDDECDVCGFAEMAEKKEPENGESTESEDTMLYCDMCNTVVHTCCAGIENPPADNEPYWCDKCRLSSNPAPKCVLCPALGGAYTHNADKTEWAHISCALFIEEIRFVNHDQRAPFSNFEDIPEERFRQFCTVCDTRLGCCVTCSHPGCEETFHVGCGLRIGLDILIDERAPVGKRQSKYRRRSKKVETQPEVFRDTHCRLHSGKVASIDPKFAKCKNPWLAKLESKFYLMTDYESVAEILQLEEIVVSDVYEYWKQKRIARNGTPLIPNLRDYVPIEPTIVRVAEKAGIDLHALMETIRAANAAAAELADGIDPSDAAIAASSQSASQLNLRQPGHFFPAAALMVTELRQHSLKRVRQAIESDREMLTMVEQREKLKLEQCHTEMQEMHAVERCLAGNGDPMAILEAWNVPKERIEQAREPEVFRGFCDYLDGAEHQTATEQHPKSKKKPKEQPKVSQNEKQQSEHKSRDLLRPPKKVTRLSLSAASSKSPLRPRNLAAAATSAEGTSASSSSTSTAAATASAAATPSSSSSSSSSATPTTSGSVGGSAESGGGRRGPGRTRIYPIG